MSRARTGSHSDSDIDKTGRLTSISQRSRTVDRNDKMAVFKFGVAADFDFGYDSRHTTATLSDDTFSTSSSQGADTVTAKSVSDKAAVPRATVCATGLLDLPQELLDSIFELAYPRVPDPKPAPLALWKYMDLRAIMEGNEAMPIRVSAASSFTICKKLFATAARAHIGNQVYELGDLFTCSKMFLHSPAARHTAHLLLEFVTEIVGTGSCGSYWLRTTELPSLRILSYTLDADAFENVAPRYVWLVELSDEEIGRVESFVNLASLRGLRKCSILPAKEPFHSSAERQAMWRRNVERFESLLKSLVLKPKMIESIAVDAEEEAGKNLLPAPACDLETSGALPTSEDHNLVVVRRRQTGPVNEDMESMLKTGSRNATTMQEPAIASKLVAPVGLHKFAPEDLDGSVGSILTAIGCDPVGSIGVLKDLRRLQLETQHTAGHVRGKGETRLSTDGEDLLTVGMSRMGPLLASSDLSTPRQRDNFTTGISMPFALARLNDHAIEPAAITGLKGAISQRSDAATQTVDWKIHNATQTHATNKHPTVKKSDAATQTSTREIHAPRENHTPGKTAAHATSPTPILARNNAATQTATAAATAAADSSAQQTSILTRNPLPHHSRLLDMLRPAEHNCTEQQDLAFPPFASRLVVRGREPNDGLLELLRACGRAWRRVAVVILVVWALLSIWGR